MGAPVLKVKKRVRAKALRVVPKIGLGMLLRDANAVFNKALREGLARHNITFSQYQHLRQLWQSDGLAQVELSGRIGIETASSTAVIDQLEAQAATQGEALTAAQSQLTALTQERDAVRQRVEKMLQQMDELL